MKLTRYEYKHNPDGKRKADTLSIVNYFPPYHRLITICILYLLGIYIGLEIFLFKNSNVIQNIIELLIIILFSIFVIEHNPLYIILLINKSICFIFTKNNVHKRLVYKLLNNYKNIVDLENKVHISKVRISYINTLKIIFYKNKMKGYVSLKKISLKNKTINNNFSLIEKEGEYIRYLKESISELYKINKHND